MHFIVSDIVLRMVAWWWYGIEWLGCGHPPSSGWSGKGGWSRHWLRMRWKYEGELKNGSMVTHIRASTDDGQWTDHQRWVKNEMNMSTRVAEGWEISCGSDQYWLSSSCWNKFVLEDIWVLVRWIISDTIQMHPAMFKNYSPELSQVIEVILDDVRINMNYLSE